MAQGIRDETSDGAGSLLKRLALINQALIEISLALRDNPAVRKVGAGCDVRRFGDEFRHPGEFFHCFGAYMEVETRSEDTIVWLLDLNLRPSGWELWRSVAKQVVEGQETLVEFPDFFAESFEAFEESLPRLMEEFFVSAKTFDFSRHI